MDRTCQHESSSKVCLPVFGHFHLQCGNVVFKVDSWQVDKGIMGMLQISQYTEIVEPCILDSVQLTWGTVVALGMIYWSGVVLHTVLVGQLEEEEEKR